MRNRLKIRCLAVLLTIVFVASAPGLKAQRAAGGQGDQFKDTSMLKLKPGEHAAIFEFEDLECPACAHAFPIVQSAISRYKIPFYRRDFPLSQHLWSRDAAITARYLEDKVSADVAEKYRGDVFANQASISSKEDLVAFTRGWFQKHSLQMPFVIDPAGRFAAEVQADQTLGDRVGLQHTPTIFVLAPNGWTQVVDVSQLYTVIDQALAQPMSAVAPKGTLKKTASLQH